MSGGTAERIRLPEPPEPLIKAVDGLLLDALGFEHEVIAGLPGKSPKMQAAELAKVLGLPNLTMWRNGRCAYSNDRPRPSYTPRQVNRRLLQLLNGQEVIEKRGHAHGAWRQNRELAKGLVQVWWRRETISPDLQLDLIKEALNRHAEVLEKEIERLRVKRDREAWSAAGLPGSAFEPSDPAAAVNVNRAAEPEVPDVDFPPALSRSLGGHATPLVLEAPAPALPVEARQSLFLRQVTWPNVCRRAYAERPILHRQILPDFRAFLASAAEARAVFKFPIFWIGGRSGDGKSVLLMQLCSAALAEGVAAHFARFTSPAAFFDWLEAQHQVNTLAGLNQPFIAVVDDLHKIPDWTRAIWLLESAATGQTHVAILTCSPTPERTLFLSDTDHVVQVTRSDSPQLRDEDYAILAQHLGLEMTPTNSSKSPLVERLFLSLPNVKARSLAAFAESLKSRVESRVDRANLLEQLTVMTLLDLGLPAQYVGSGNAAWLDELAAETQLHIELGEDGYRFGHPAIAAPMFEVLTSVPGKANPVELRLAKTLSPMLAAMPSLNGVVRILRQILARIPHTNLGDVMQLLQRLYELAPDSKVSSATAVAMIHQMNRQNLDIDRRWRSLARTLRDSRQTAPETRAHLASQLIAAKNPDEADFDAALRALSEPDVRPYMGRFLRSLLTAKARQLGWMFKALQPTLAWCASQPESRTTQELLFGYLAQYPQDTRLRRQALEYLRRTAPENVSSYSMVIAAKLMEEQAAELIRKWLRAHHGNVAGAHVLGALLAKPGNSWEQDALLFLRNAPRDPHDLAKVLRHLLPHMPFDPVIEAMTAQVARELMDDADVNFFRGLAQVGSRFNVNPHLAERLDVLWSGVERGDPPDEAFELIGSCWNRLAAERPEIPQRVEWMFRRMSHLQDASGAAPPKGSVANSLRHGLELVVAGGRHAHLYLPGALRYLDSALDTPLRGFVAARLLLFEHAEGVSAGELGEEVRQRIPEAVEICWAKADPRLDGVREGPFCAAALARARWEAEPDRVRELMRGYWQPSLRSGAARTMSAWLSVEAARQDALALLLDESYKLGSRWDTERASVVARNLDVAFEAVSSGMLRSEQARYLDYLLSTGIGDYEQNPSSAWAALQRLGNWPSSAERAIWRGILRSALEGATVTRDLYWDAFQRWQEVNNDEYCERIILSSDFGHSG